MDDLNYIFQQNSGEPVDFLEDFNREHIDKNNNNSDYFMTKYENTIFTAIKNFNLLDVDSLKDIVCKSKNNLKFVVTLRTTGHKFKDHTKHKLPIYDEFTLSSSFTLYDFLIMATNLRNSKFCYTCGNSLELDGSDDTTVRFNLKFTDYSFP